MNFLHISDLHFGIEKKGDLKETHISIRENYMNKLIQEIREITSETSLDYVFVTGDIAWDASKEDYESAGKWIREKLLPAAGLNVDRICLCPGNHDIIRDEAEELEFPENQAKANKYLAVERLNHSLIRRFQTYHEFCTDMGLKKYKIGSQESFLTGICDMGDCYVICLNTAWYAKGDSYKDKMWVGSNFIEVLKADLSKLEKKPTIILMHHPKTSWNEAERSHYSDSKNVYVQMCELADLVLAGHTHEEICNGEVVERAFVAPAGATYQSPLYHHHFCLYKIDFTNPYDHPVQVQYCYHTNKWDKREITLDTENKAPWKMEAIQSLCTDEKMIAMIETIPEQNEEEEKDPETADPEYCPCDLALDMTKRISDYYLDSIMKKVASDTEKLRWGMLKELLQKLAETFDEMPWNWESLVEQILKEEDQKVGLLIQGSQGTGKSTFLSVLYELCCEAYQQGKTMRLAVYIDLHKLDAVSLDEAENRLETDLRHIRNLLNKGYRIYFFLDGFDDYLRIHRKLETIVKEFVTQYQERVIICIGDTDGLKYGEGSESKSSIHTIHKVMGMPGIKLRTCKIKMDHIDEVIKDLMYIISKEKLYGRVDKIVSILKGLDTFEVDFRTVYRMIQIADMNKDILNQNNIALAYHEYFSNLYDAERLYQEGKYAYLYMVHEGKIGEEIYENACVLYENHTTRDFLAANFYLRTVLKAEEEEAAENVWMIKELAYPFTPGVNRMLKKLMKAKWIGKQIKLTDCMIKLYLQEDTSEYARGQLTYVLGRVTSTQAIKKATRFLQEQYKKLEAEIYKKEEGKNLATDLQILLYRSVAVSLIFLGDRNYEEDYLNNVLYDPRLNYINRGFNLSYYGDAAYCMGEIPTYDDDIEMSIDKTLNHLIRSIHERLVSGNEKLQRTLGMEIVTLFSIYEYRLSRQEVYSEYKEEILKLADEILGSMKPYSKIAKRYTEMMKEIVAEEKPYRYIMEELYRTKFEKRVGWINRGIAEPESVMDHMYSCYILGKFLLPETVEELQEYPLSNQDDYKDYNKGEILDTLLLHDLGESYIGDKYRKSEDDVERENKRFYYYSLLSSMPHLHGLGRDIRLWKNLYERRSINAKIANDIDKIDPMVQAFIYKRRGEAIDMEEWINEVNTLLLTDLGRCIYNFLIENVMLK